MLSVVGHPAAVNPDARLARLARTYGWPVMTLKKVPGPRHAHAGAS
jgi:phosphoserine phosphatase